MKWLCLSMKWLCLSMKWLCLSMKWSCLSMKWLCISIKWLCLSMKWLCLSMKWLCLSMKWLCLSMKSCPDMWLVTLKKITEVSVLSGYEPCAYKCSRYWVRTQYRTTLYSDWHCSHCTRPSRALLCETHVPYCMLKATSFRRYIFFKRKNYEAWHEFYRVLISP